MTSDDNVEKLHPDEVFQGIIDYLASTSYALKNTSKLDLTYFDKKLMGKINIAPPVYTYTGT